MLLNDISDFEEIHFFEETVKSGGIGEHLSALLSKSKYNGKLYIHAIENEFIKQSSIKSALKNAKLDCDSMLNI